MVHDNKMVHITSLIFKYVDNDSFYDCFILELCSLKGQNTWSLKYCVVTDSFPLLIVNSRYTRVKLMLQKQPPEVFCKKRCSCAKISFLIKLQASVCIFIKKETLAQVFSCAFWEIFKNTCFTEHLWTASGVD